MVTLHSNLYRPLARTWTELDRNHPAGSTELHLKDDPVALGWRVGDRVGVATTSRYGGWESKDDPVALGWRVGDRVDMATTSR
jgi:hypothetical protein